VVYVLIGYWPSGSPSAARGAADHQGAPAQVAAQPFGKTMLWALVVDFDCMALWRGAHAVLGRASAQGALASA
jgi:hypothetical protein